MPRDRDDLDDDPLGGLLAEAAWNRRGAPWPPLQPKGWDELSAADYEAVPADDSIEEKIRSLREVTDTIEAKVVTADAGVIPAGLRVDYAGSLNAAQLAAVTTIDGPLLVIAGAGSGKTRVIVYRVSYLIERGVAPEEILLLTFTRRASQEMLSRVSGLLADARVGHVTGGTFHSFANWALRRHAALVGLPPSFTILDAEDSADVLDLVRSELGFAKRDKAFPRKARLAEIVSSARNRGITIREAIARDWSGLEEFADDIQVLAEGYVKYKRAAGVVDFDDLMELLRDALRDNAAFRERIQARFRYVMVDEYQDTNLPQKEIADLLAAASGNLMVVGDDAQSIYGFRGARYENILRFPADWPACRVVKIEENYRSHQQLLDFSNAVLASARLGYKKRLVSPRHIEAMPCVKKCWGQEDEASFIVSRILALREKGIALRDVAVLVRAAWHWRYVELELSRRGIPYVVVGGIRFAERRHVKDILAYLRLVINPRDAVCWQRVLKLFPGLGEVSARQVARAVLESGDARGFSAFGKKKFHADLIALGAMLGRAQEDSLPVAGKIQLVKEYYAPLLELQEADWKTRLLDIDVLIDLAKKYEDLEKFLSDFALDPPSRTFAGAARPLIDESEEDPVTLSTVHSAKGLEWHAVFVPHALDGLFPSSRALKSYEELEEERRLFYVAVSRAKHELVVSMPGSVAQWGAFFSTPSRFLVEVGRKFFEPG